MVAFNGHYDGKVIVPDAPLNLPPNQRLAVRAEPVDGPMGVTALRGVDGNTLTAFAGAIPEPDLRAMRAAIEEACERVDSNEW